jgi:hypothetical protein
MHHYYLQIYELVRTYNMYITTRFMCFNIFLKNIFLK